MTIANMNTGQFIAFNPNTGKPLVGGKVYFFEPSTLTPKATFVDRAGSSQNPHPVILDSVGAARIWIDGAYDVRIDDANDVTISTLESVYGALDEGSIAQALSEAASEVAIDYGTTNVSSDTTLTTSAAAKIVLVNASGGDVTISLPAAANMAGKAPFTIRRTDTSSNLVTIDGDGSEAIDGFAAEYLAPGWFVELRSDGTEWFVTAKTDGTPIGDARMFAGDTPPGGYLKRNGAEISRTTYAKLWAFAQASGFYDATGTNTRAFGPGDGSTTFDLPDHRGLFERAHDDGAGVDSGRALASYQGDTVKDHTHGSGTLGADSAGEHNHRTIASEFPIFGETSSGTAADGARGEGIALSSTDGAHPHTISGSTGNPDSGGGAETRPKNVALTAIIKAY